jgi:hypothetical protein
MEFVIIVIAVCALRVLTNLFGYDSAAGLHPPEERAAADGMR